jgi:hypothetical protein
MKLSFFSPSAQFEGSFFYSVRAIIDKNTSIFSMALSKLAAT